MPYPYGDNWFFDADVKDQQRLERQAVEALAALHELTADGGPAGFLAAPDDGAATSAITWRSSGPTTTGWRPTASAPR